tara:strand:- start:769 stop:918 length:150 start_codon:yes stop_codon:yes gene_type:complete
MGDSPRHTIMNASITEAERKAEPKKQHITIFSAPKQGIYKKTVEDFDSL